MVKCWYFLATPTAGGSAVAFTIAEGTEDNHTTLGSIIFELYQWDRFAPIIYAGQRAAGYMRIPVQFRDRTHTQKRNPQ